MKPKFRYVFVILVYKNIDVLKEFFASLYVDDCHIVVVNSYYDDDTLKDCKKTAYLNNADFISIENKGFGYGNNVGTEYVMENYEFEYLILSNSDIHVKKIKALDKLEDDMAVIAPYTHLPEGKVQNPNIPWRINCMFDLLKKAYDTDSRIRLAIPHMMTRLSREFFKIYRLFVRKNFYKIYSCHGSFIIFTKKAVERLFPFFDDRMFLYNEELYLAENCRKKDVSVYYCPQIDILHLEGASTGHELGFERNKESFSILYDWMKKNRE